MTAKPDLLPSSVAALTEALHGDRGSLDAWLEVNDERDVRVNVEAYARARVAHATAAKDAEVEALRAEVERLKFDMGCLQQQYDERTAYMIVHRGSALACSDAVRSAYSDEHCRAERLEEALRQIADYEGDPRTPVHSSVKKSAIARAALEQKPTNQPQEGKSNA